MRKALIFLSLPLLSFAVTLSTFLDKVQSNDLVQSKISLKNSQEKQLSSLKSAYLPRVEVGGVYAYLRDEDKGFFDPETNINVSASYTLFDGFKQGDLLQAQKYRLAASKQWIDFEKERLSLEAIKLYFNLRTQEVWIQASEQKIKQLQSEVFRLEKLFEAHVVGEDILESIKASLAMSEYDLLRQKQEESSLRFSLTALSGLEFKDIQTAFFKENNEDSSRLTRDLLAQEYELKALAKQAQAQTSDYLPKVILRDTYSTTSYYESDLSLPSFELPTEKNKLEVLLSWTLVDFGSQSDAKQKIMLEKKAKNEELNYYKKVLRSKQQIAKMELFTSKEKIRSSFQNLKASQKSFEFRQKRFQANLIDSTIFLEALTSYTQAQALYAQAQNDYEIAKANYYFNHNISLKEKLL